MKALTVHQPWAWAIATGYKDIENRPMQTRHRGPLALHAGRQYRFDAEEFTPLKQALVNDRGDFGGRMWSNGAVIAVISVVGCHPSSECHGGCSPWAMNTRWHWELADPKPLDQPIPARGLQGLWNWEAS